MSEECVQVHEAETRRCNHLLCNSDVIVFEIVCIFPVFHNYTCSQLYMLLI